MGMLNHEFRDLNDLFCHQLGDLYDAENRLTDALPKMADAATDPMLKEAFTSHLGETHRHIERLEEVFRVLGKDPKRETCPAMKGLLKEGEDAMGATGNDMVRDAALIASAQRVEHYEIAGYGTLRAFAKRMGMPEVADLLQQTLDEEGAADQKLTQIAESGINDGAPIHA